MWGCCCRLPASCAGSVDETLAHPGHPFCRFTQCSIAKQGGARLRLSSLRGGPPSTPPGAGGGSSAQLQEPSKKADPDSLEPPKTPLAGGPIFSPVTPPPPSPFPLFLFLLSRPDYNEDLWADDMGHGAAFCGVSCCSTAYWPWCNPCFDLDPDVG